MYTAKLLGQIDNGKGYWSYQSIGVFHNDEQVCSFQRNYSSYGISTFAPFERDGKWYALYSPKYTGLAIMELPSGIQLGSEPCESHGFCPVQVFVPTYRLGTYEWSGKTYFYKEYDSKLWDEETVGPVMYENVAFVAGCVWGDDSSWKIEMRDISKAPEGIISRLDIGYNIMPGHLSLQECIRLNDGEAYEQGQEPNKYLSLGIACEKTIHVNDGNIKIFEF